MSDEKEMIKTIDKLFREYADSEAVVTTNEKGTKIQKKDIWISIYDSEGKTIISSSFDKKKYVFDGRVGQIGRLINLLSSHGFKWSGGNNFHQEKLF